MMALASQGCQGERRGVRRSARLRNVGGTWVGQLEGWSLRYLPALDRLVQDVSKTVSTLALRHLVGLSERSAYAAITGEWGSGETRDFNLQSQVSGSSQVQRARKGAVQEDGEEQGRLLVQKGCRRGWAHMRKSKRVTMALLRADSGCTNWPSDKREAAPARRMLY